MAETYLLAMWCPVYRWRDSNPGSEAEKYSIFWPSKKWGATGSKTAIEMDDAGFCLRVILFALTQVDFAHFHPFPAAYPVIAAIADGPVPMLNNCGASFAMRMKLCASANHKAMHLTFALPRTGNNTS